MSDWQPGVSLEDVERMTIVRALRFYHGNRTHTAESLGIALRTLSNKITKYRQQGHMVPHWSTDPAEEQSASRLS